ncbi:MAG TPA: hypothetical protein VH326_15490 [Sphingomonas sp.]|jgi:hypothetical protein|nr:hypothetical protein [Sphingomonas sp.]
MNAVEQSPVPSERTQGRKPWATPTVIVDSASSTRSLVNNAGPDGVSSYSSISYGS